MPRAIINTDLVDGGALLTAHVPDTQISTSTFVELPLTDARLLCAHAFLRQELNEMRDHKRGHWTGAQKARFIQGGGKRCTFCGSEDLYRPSFRYPALKATAWNDVALLVECNACQMKWIEKYTLSGIKTIEEASDVDAR